jgi:hypothetical protein
MPRRIDHHAPFELCDLASTKPSADAQKHDDSVSVGGFGSARATRNRRLISASLRVLACRPHIATSSHIIDHHADSIACAKRNVSERQKIDKLYQMLEKMCAVVLSILDDRLRSRNPSARHGTLARARKSNFDPKSSTAAPRNPQRIVG